jgi:hypothetical protein
LLENRFPGIQGQVEVVDVATTQMTERFTGIDSTYDMNLGFSCMLGFLRGKPRTSPGLSNFSVGGQAGLPGCAEQARNTIQRICKEQETKFNSTKS